MLFRSQLQRLELRITSIDDQAMQVISAWPDVDYLDISECRLVSREGLALIGKLTKLRTLELWETKLNDEALAALSALVNLEELNLEATDITNESVPTLLKFQNLARLNIAGTQLDDDGIKELAKLPKLTWLNLANSGATFAASDELKKVKPEIEIVE